MADIKFDGVLNSDTNLNTHIQVEQPQAQVTSGWVSSSFGSQTGFIALYAADYTGVLKEGFRVVSSGSAPKAGFFGSAVAKQTMTITSAGTTYTTSEQTMLNNLYGVLKNYGMVQ